MQLSAASTTLLSSVLLALTSQEVLAAPFQGPGANTITMSLGRREPSPQSFHPQIELQRRMNTNQRRMAQIARRAPPTDAQLKASMDARAASIVAAGGSVAATNSTTPAVPSAGGVTDPAAPAAGLTPSPDPSAAGASGAGAAGAIPAADATSSVSASASSAAPSAPTPDAAASVPTPAGTVPSVPDAAGAAGAVPPASGAVPAVPTPDAGASAAVPAVPAPDAGASPAVLAVPTPDAGASAAVPAPGVIPPADPAAAAPVPGRFASPALQASMAAAAAGASPSGSATPPTGAAPVPPPLSQAGVPAAATNSSALANLLSNPALAGAAAAGGAYLVLPGASLKKAGYQASTGPDGNVRIHRNRKKSTAAGRVRLHRQRKQHLAKTGHKLKQHDNDDDGNGDGDNSQDSNSEDGSSSSSESGDDNGQVEQVTDSVTPTEPDSLALEIEAQDLSYFITVQIGTPPKPFRVTVDSGSSDFWVEGSNCKASKGGKACASDHAFISEETSSTFVDTGEAWNITYGSGAVSGEIVRDDVVIDGLALKDHIFGTANRESSDFSSFSIPYDGLMGLGLSVGSNQQVPNPVDALASAGLIKGAITSYKISRQADGKHDGEITFGGMDPSKFQANTLVTMPVVSTIGFWETALDAAGIQGGGSIPSGKRTAIHDTGTTGIIAPVKDAEALHKLIPGAKSDGHGGYTVPCNTQTKVTLTFGGKPFPIDPRDLSEFGPVDSNKPNGQCVSAISGDTGGDDSANQWLLGDTFLKNVYLSTKGTGSSTGYVSLAQLS